MKSKNASSVEIAPGSVKLTSPSFVYELDTSRGLAAKSWTNLLTDRKLSLGGGSEFGIDFDAADKRIPIVGWWTCPTNSGPIEPDKEMGYVDTAYAFDHYEADWTSRPAPLFDQWPESPENCNWVWARTHLFLTRDLEAKDMTLVLGGFAMFDYRYMRVFVNGHEIGVRRVKERRHEPGKFALGPGTEAHKWLRFDRDNVIALQMSGFMARTAALDAVDPNHNRQYGVWLGWPVQFEQYVVVGKALQTPALKVVEVEKVAEGDAGDVRVRMTAGPSTEAIATYRWNSREPVLHRRLEIVDRGRSPKRLMHVRLGTYPTGAPASDGDQGFPVYVDNQFFVGLAHPSGWVTGQKGLVELRQYPGVVLQPGKPFESMEAVMGVSPAGKAREGFLTYLQSRMRRTVAKHDKPYAIFETFGSWSEKRQDGSNRADLFWGAEEADILHLAGKLDEGTRQTGFKFDFFTIELWMDHNGDGERPDLKRFPNRFSKITPEVERQGMKLGLWTDSDWLPWTFTGNPVIHGCYNWDGSYGAGDRPAVCRAEEPFKSMFTDAQLRLARNSGVRLFKFDNLIPICYNPSHGHLPGVYSTEAFQSAVIGTLDAIGHEFPDAFLMLYWGYRSPWWLLHGDTLFESGVALEAASPAESPSLFARDSVTVGLDQATDWAVDIPKLGKDSLGVWLSDWGWNSSVGNERWAEGVVMDICRGSLLAQVWTDWNWLTEPERRQFADLVGLLRAQPKCFGNPKPIVGNPWKHEPYGYCCSDGKRAFLAINNCTWSDVQVPLRLNGEWGLPARKTWDVVRWYPSPARLGPAPAKPVLSMRPFDVVLLELVPHGAAPSLDRPLEAAQWPDSLGEKSTVPPVTITGGDPSQADNVARDDSGGGKPPKRVTFAECELPATAAGGLAAITVELRRGSVAAPHGNIGVLFAATAEVDGATAEAKPILGMWTYASPWQGWRVKLGPSRQARKLRLKVTAMLDADVELTWKAHFVPR